MSNPYISLENFAVEAELYGLFRMVPKKMTCTHATCGYHSSQYWDSQLGKNIPRSPHPVKCTYERYIKCTNAELGNPNAKVGTIFAAIRVAVVRKGGWSNSEWEAVPMIFLYDLIGDAVKESWFQRGGNGSVAPHSGAGQNWPNPSTLKNLKDVVEGMKKNL